MLLNIGAVFMGTALTIRDLIGERPIFQREQAVGLSTTAYLLAKVAVFCAFAIMQAAIATAIVGAGQGRARPRDPRCLRQLRPSSCSSPSPATCVASAMLGLVLSALAQSNEQIMPLLVVSIMSQLVLCRRHDPGDRPDRSRPVVLADARALGLRRGGVDDRLPEPGAGPQIPTKDPIWQHSKHIFLFDMGMLVALSLFYAGFVRWRIRLKR